MNEKKDIKDISKRIEAIEEVLAEAAGGNLLVRIKLDMDQTDRLTGIETGINLILSDLEDETSQRLLLLEELQQYKKV